MYIFLDNVSASKVDMMISEYNVKTYTEVDVFSSSLMAIVA